MLVTEPATEDGRKEGGFDVFTSARLAEGAVRRLM